MTPGSLFNFSSEPIFQASVTLAISGFYYRYCMRGDVLLTYSLCLQQTTQCKPGDYIASGTSKTYAYVTVDTAEGTNFLEIDKPFNLGLSTCFIAVTVSIDGTTVTITITDDGMCISQAIVYVEYCLAYRQ